MLKGLKEIRGICALCQCQVLLRYHDPVSEDYLVPIEHLRSSGPRGMIACKGVEMPALELEDETAQF